MKPFSQICELSSFATSQVYMEPTVPRIAWKQDMTALSIDGENISLEGLRDGLKSQTEAVKKSILLVTGEVEVPDWLSKGPPIKDDPRNGEPGYSFLEDDSFRDAHLPLLQHLVEHPGWGIGILDNEQRWVWNMSAIIRFFKETGAIQKAIMPLIRICSNDRGTELSDTKVANSASRLRNLTVYQGRLFNNGAYSKTTENTGHDSYNPSLFPTEISLLLVHYLAVIRPVEKILSRVIWDDDVAALYGTYLFLVQGRKLTSEDDSEFLRLFFQDHCDAVIQLNRWRQTSASLSREFIDDRFLAANRRSAVGMGHSVAIARKHYGQDHDTPAFATSDVLYEQSWVDTEFHALLGFGSKPPPLALRLRNSDDDTIQATIRAALKDMKQEIVREVLEGLGDIIKRETSLLIPKGPDHTLKQDHVRFPSPSVPDSEPYRTPRLLKRTHIDEDATPTYRSDKTPKRIRNHVPFSSPSIPDSQAGPLPTHTDKDPCDLDVFYQPEQNPSSPLPPLAVAPSPREDKDPILAAFRTLYGPEARPKSDQQYRLCEQVLLKESNIIAVLPTGSGKSAAWLVPAVVNIHSIIVVVVPFKQLLQQHLTTALNHKLKAVHWVASKGLNVAPETNLLFVACESLAAKKFSE